MIVVQVWLYVPFDCNEVNRMNIILFSTHWNDLRDFPVLEMKGWTQTRPDEWMIFPNFNRYCKHNFVSSLANQRGESVSFRRSFLFAEVAAKKIGTFKQIFSRGKQNSNYENWKEKHQFFVEKLMSHKRLFLCGSFQKRSETKSFKWAAEPWKMT